MTLTVAETKLCIQIFRLALMGDPTAQLEALHEEHKVSLQGSRDQDLPVVIECDNSFPIKNAGRRGVGRMRHIENKFTEVRR